MRRGCFSFTYRLVRTRTFKPLRSRSIKTSISDSSFSTERLTRMEQSASCAESPKAVSARLGVRAWEEQADPLETKMPSPER